jgi:hypothetical protein
MADLVPSGRQLNDTGSYKSRTAAFVRKRAELSLLRMWLISSLTEVNGRYLPATRTPKASALAITNGKGGIETQLELKSADGTTRNWRARPSESAKRCLPEFS